MIPSSSPSISFASVIGSSAIDNHTLSVEAERHSFNLQFNEWFKDIEKRIPIQQRMLDLNNLNLNPHPITFLPNSIEYPNLNYDLSTSTDRTPVVADVFPDASFANIPPHMFPVAAIQTSLDSIDLVNSKAAIYSRLKKHMVIEGEIKSKEKTGDWLITVDRVLDTTLCNLFKGGLIIQALLPQKEMSEEQEKFVDNYEIGSPVRAAILEIPSSHYSPIVVTFRRSRVYLRYENRTTTLGPYELTDYSRFDTNGDDLMPNNLVVAIQKDPSFSNHASIISMTEQLKLDDYSSLFRSPSSSLKQSDYIEHLRTVQNECWAKDIAANGWRYIDRNNFEKAYDAFSQALALHIVCKEAIMGMVEILQRKGLWSDLFLFLDVAIALDYPRARTMYQQLSSVMKSGRDTPVTEYSYYRKHPEALEIRLSLDDLTSNPAYSYLIPDLNQIYKLGRDYKSRGYLNDHHTEAKSGHSSTDNPLKSHVDADHISADSHAHPRSSTNEIMPPRRDQSPTPSGRYREPQERREKDHPCSGPKIEHDRVERRERGGDEHRWSFHDERDRSRDHQPRLCREIDRSSHRDERRNERPYRHSSSYQGHDEHPNGHSYQKCSYQYEKRELGSHNNSYYINRVPNTNPVTPSTRANDYPPSELHNLQMKTRHKSSSSTSSSDNRSDQWILDDTALMSRRTEARRSRDRRDNGSRNYSDDDLHDNRSTHKRYKSSSPDRSKDYR